MKDRTMTTEQMRQKSAETRKAAKALQQKLQIVADPEERKHMARQMNELFNEASQLKYEAKYRHGMEESIEREFLSIHENLEDD